MIIWVCTDMEGLAGVDHWDQCYDPDDHSPKYRYGREQLTADTNAAISGCFDAGATEVRVFDGHGRNANKGFTAELDPRAKRVWFASYDPSRLEGLDETVHALAVIGQHAMAGTLHGFLDHTNNPKTICRRLINGVEHGEPSALALYGGCYGVPLVYASGDEALCEEMRRLFPRVVTTPSKRGTGWDTCELYPVSEVRARIRREIAAALRNVDRSNAWSVKPPMEIEVEWAWCGLADPLARLPGVGRPHPRITTWKINDVRDVFSWPSRQWHPAPPRRAHASLYLRSTSTLPEGTPSAVS